MSANGAPATILDALFAALLTSEAVPADQIEMLAANDGASAPPVPPQPVDPTTIPFIASVPAQPSVTAPVRARSSDVSLPTQSNGKADDEAPIKQNAADVSGDALAEAALAAIMALQNPQPMPVKAETLSDSTAEPGKDVAPAPAAASDKTLSPSTPMDETASPATPEQQAASATATPDKATAPPADESAPINGTPQKSFSPALAATEAPRSASGTQHSHVMQAQASAITPTDVTGDQSDAQPQTDERPPQEQANPQPSNDNVRRTDSPTLTAKSAALEKSPVKTENAQPQAGQSFAQAGVAHTPSPAHSTAATLHTVSTLRDVPVLPNLQSIAVQITSSAEGGLKHFEIRMDPAELGRVDVHLTLDDAGQAQASLVVEKPHALELLQKDSSGLEKALRDAGFDLANNGLSFSLKGQERQQDQAPRTHARARNLQATAAVEAAAPANTNLLSAQSGLDIRV